MKKIRVRGKHILVQYESEDDRMGKPIYWLRTTGHTAFPVPFDVYNSVKKGDEIEVTYGKHSLPESLKVWQ